MAKHSEFWVVAVASVARGWVLGVELVLSVGDVEVVERVVEEFAVVERHVWVLLSPAENCRKAISHSRML